MWVRILSEQLQINSDFPCNDINMVHNYLWIKVFLVGSHRGKRWTKNLITCLYANCFKLEYLQTVGVIKNWMIYAANICFEVYISGFCLFSLFVFNILDKIERFFFVRLVWLTRTPRGKNLLNQSKLRMLLFNWIWMLCTIYFGWGQQQIKTLWKIAIDTV